MSESFKEVLSELGDILEEEEANKVGIAIRLFNNLEWEDGNTITQEIGYVGEISPSMLKSAFETLELTDELEHIVFEMKDMLSMKRK